MLHEYHIQVGYYASNNSTDHRLQCVSRSLPGRTLWKCNSLVRNERYCPNSFTLVHSRVCFHRDFCNSSSFTMSAYSVSAHSLWRITDSMNLEIIYLLYDLNLHKCSTTCMYTGENNNSNQNDELFYRSFWIQHYRSCILYPVSFIANSLLVDFSSCFSCWYSQ